MNRGLNSADILWRTIVHRTRESRLFFFGFMGVCLAVPWAVAEGFIWASRRNQEKLHEKLQGGRYGVGQEMARINKQRLQELLDDVKNKRDINDRYAAALRGEIMTGPPEARVVHKGGATTFLPLPVLLQAKPLKPEEPQRA